MSPFCAYIIAWHTIISLINRNKSQDYFLTQSQITNLEGVVVDSIEMYLFILTVRSLKKLTNLHLLKILSTTTWQVSNCFYCGIRQQTKKMIC